MPDHVSDQRTGIRVPRSLSRLASSAAILVWAPLLWSQTSLTLASGTAAPGGAVDLNLSYISAQSSVAALQWSLSYSSTDVASVTVTASDAANAAQKSLLCNATGNSDTCLAAGLTNANPISDGVIATVHVVLTANPSSSVAIQVSNTVAADPNGNAVPLAGSSAAISVAQAAPSAPSAPSAPGAPAPPSSPVSPSVPVAAVAGVTCAPPLLVGLSTSTCTVSLTLSAQGDTPVSLASSSPALTVPAIVTVPSGTTTVSFPATGATSDPLATITASSGGNSTALTLNLLPSLASAAFNLVNNLTGQCFAVLHASDTSKVQVVEDAACASNPADTVQLTPAGTGYALSVAGGLRLDSLVASTTSPNDLLVLLTPASASPTQVWTLAPSADGSLTVVSQATSKCLSGADPSSPGLPLLRQSACNGTAAQNWHLVRLTQ